MRIWSGFSIPGVCVGGVMSLRELTFAENMFFLILEGILQGVGNC